MTEKPDSLSQSSSETHVDLGEDLLEKTAFIPGLTASKAHVPSPLDIPAGESGSIDDLLHSAKILVDEGLIEDAKKILHRILIIDSSNKMALEAINRIQKEELKYLLREDATRQRTPQRKPQRKQEIQEVDPEKLMRKLDQDLGLGIFAQNFPVALASDLSLFQNPEEMAAFSLKLEKNLVGANIQDWVDLGIAFLEMDFYQIAARLFTGVCRKIDSEMQRDQSISATSLLALSLILLGRPFEAISKLQPLLRDGEIKADQKIEIYYLMGRTYESLDKSEFALHFYHQVMEIDACYRDVKYRVRNRK